MNHVLIGSSIMTKYNNALFNNKLIKKDFIWRSLRMLYASIWYANGVLERIE
jgi:hypothetical protein